MFLQFGQFWGMYFLITAAPKFVNEVLDFDLSSTGFLTSLPFVLRFIVALGVGALNDYLASATSINKLWIRKGACILCILRLPENDFDCRHTIIFFCS